MPHKKRQASEKEARSDSWPRASLDLESCIKSLHGLSESERDRLITIQERLVDEACKNEELYRDQVREQASRAKQGQIFAFVVVAIVIAICVVCIFLYDTPYVMLVAALPAAACLVTSIMGRGKPNSKESSNP